MIEMGVREQKHVDLGGAEAETLRVRFLDLRTVLKEAAINKDPVHSIR
jgi:hypothetical protein